MNADVYDDMAIEEIAKTVPVKMVDISNLTASGQSDKDKDGKTAGW